MIRIVINLAILAGIAFGGWWVWNNVPPVRNFVENHVGVVKRQFKTLEMRYTADQIMERHRQELLKDRQHIFGDTDLLFYPYALLEVKYTEEDQTKEAVILWGLEDGEMVVHTSSWERSHGFEDCLLSGADQNDYRLVAAVARNGNAMSYTDMLGNLALSEEELDHHLDSCLRKKLIVQSGSAYRLHFQSPHLEVEPKTQIHDSLVTKAFQSSKRIPRRYNIHQIEKGAIAAFGSDFTIRRTTEVYLPVHRIEVHNPDGTTHTTHWNALSGQRIERPAGFLQ